MALLFAATLFTSAVLLFWIQPLIAKMLLPFLGGTPGVWNICMLFFQGMLLAGYAYALAATKWLKSGWQVGLHTGLLLVAWLFLPIAISDATARSVPAEGNPTGWLVLSLLGTLGMPFFVLSATAPLLQKWFAQTEHPRASDPYFLYAASNAGSLVALVGFPLLLEPHATLHQQSRMWTVGYAALAGLIIACAVALWRSGVFAAPDDQARRNEERREPELEEQSGRVTLRRRLSWTLLAFVPSSLVLGITTYITTDIAAVPLLWLIPLSLYLLTFVLAFARRQFVHWRLLMRALMISALVVSLVLLSGASEPAWFLVLVHLAFLFFAALVSHRRLADERPLTKHLAEYYLWIAVGGMLGGFFNALAAPLLFDRVIEYPLMIVLACMTGPREATKKDRFEDQPRDRRLDVALPAVVGALTAVFAMLAVVFKLGVVESTALMLGVPLMIINHLFTKRPVRFALGLGAVMLGSSFYAAETGRTLYRERNFYGTLRVWLDPSRGVRKLYHGNTIHGEQFIDESRRCEPLSYYHRSGPLGSIFEAFHQQPARPNVAVVGLGTGASVAYAKPDERWTFYEINPAVISLARDTKLFTYLSECTAGAAVEILVGDARLQLQKAPDAYYGLVVLDAFSSDAVPVHLLTREAFDLYVSKLAKQGMVAVHVSNRSLNLHAVIGDLARDANLTALVFNDPKYDPKNGRAPSQWVVIARQTSDLGALTEDPRWRLLPGRPRPEVWTDDFSGIVSVFKWRG